MFAWELLKEIKVTNSTFKSSEQPPEDTCQTVKGIHVQIGYKLESIRATTAGVDFSTYSTDHREFICTWCDTQQKAVQILKLPSYPGVKKLFVCKLKGPNFLAAA